MSMTNNIEETWKGGFIICKIRVLSLGEIGMERGTVEDPSASTFSLTEEDHTLANSLRFALNQESVLSLTLSLFVYYYDHYYLICMHMLRCFNVCSLKHIKTDACFPTFTFVSAETRTLVSVTLCERGIHRITMLEIS